MTQPWVTAGETDTKEGRLQVRRRGDQDITLLLDGRVLQSSQSHAPETDLVQFVIERMKGKERPQFFLAGLGLGFGLRTALDLLPERAQIAVFEPHPELLRWARGPLADFTGKWLDDPRVTVVTDDVTTLFHNAARAGGRDRFDAIALDAYTGVSDRLSLSRDPWFGQSTLRWAHGALYKDGVFGLWSEETEFRLESRFRHFGYRYEVIQPRRKGPSFVVYLAAPVGTPRGRDKGSPSEAKSAGDPQDTAPLDSSEVVSPSEDSQPDAPPAPEESVIVGSRRTSRRIPRGRDKKAGGGGAGKSRRFGKSGPGRRSPAKRSRKS